MSKSKLSKTPPPVERSRLKARLLRTTALTPLVAINDPLAIRLAFDAIGIQFA